MTRDELLERLGITTEAAAWPIDAYVAAERERLAQELEERRPHIPRLDNPKRRQRVIERSTLNRAAKIVRGDRS